MTLVWPTDAPTPLPLAKNLNMASRAWHRRNGSLSIVDYCDFALHQVAYRSLQGRLRVERRAACAVYALHRI
jgi:hypothetical protein